MAKVDFPSNSEKQPAPEREKLTPVTQARVDVNPFKKLLGAFLADDLNDAGDYFIRRILGPSMKSFVANLGKDIIDLIFYGQTLGSYADVPTRSVNREKYARVSTAPKQQAAPRAKTSGSLYEDPIVSSRGGAEIVLDQLQGIADEYGFARVLDLYDLCGLDTNFTQANYGWSPEQVNHARVMPIHRIGSDDEYIIKMPRPIQID